MIKILIIEDETYIAMQLENLVEKIGHEVVASVDSSEKAYDIVSNNHVDLIISDIRINGLVDGIETIEKIYQSQQIPVIFITGDYKQETLNRISKLNFVSYIAKPFQEANVKAQIELAILNYGLPRKQILCINDTLELCLETKSLVDNNTYIHLTNKEFTLIHYLVLKKNEIVTYDIIEALVWEEKFVTDVMRRQLKYRIMNKSSNLPLEVISGIGFRFNITPPN